MIDPLPHAWTFEALGTSWRVDTRAPLGGATRDAVRERIARFDLDWSRFRDDGRIGRIARDAGRHELAPDAGPLLALYRELWAATGGRMSPLVGRTLETLGYDAAYRLVPGDPAPVPPWDDAVAWDGTTLTVARPTVLDVGAAGKGYLVDLVGDLLAAAGETEQIVDASGDLRSRGIPPMRVALEHPADPAKAIGVAELGDAALAASASNRRAWGPGLHHVLDAITGLPTADVVATWALAPTCLVADGCATALFFDVDPDLLSRWDVEWVRMFADGRVERSADFPGEVFA